MANLYASFLVNEGGASQGSDTTYLGVDNARPGVGKGAIPTARSVGAIVNAGIAAYLFQSETIWVPAELAGILIGAF